MATLSLRKANRMDIKYRFQMLEESYDPSYQKYVDIYNLMVYINENPINNSRSLKKWCMSKSISFGNLRHLRILGYVVKNVLGYNISKNIDYKNFDLNHCKDIWLNICKNRIDESSVEKRLIEKEKKAKIFLKSRGYRVLKIK